MKKAISILAFTILFFLGYSQHGVNIPERPESEKKTEFKHSIFKSNYLVQETLVRFLNTSPELLSLDSDSLYVRATDLYYDKSADYRRDKKIVYWLKEKYLVSEERKIEVLDSALKINKKWIAAIVEDQVIDEILRTIYNGEELLIDKNTIYAVSPLSRGADNRVIYKFEFNKDKRIISKNLGRIVGNDSLYWVTSNYEYEKDQLSKEVNKRCNGYDCLRGYELVTKIYNKGQLIKSTEQKFSRKDNELIQEDITDYSYRKKELDSSIKNTYQKRGESLELNKTTTCKYKNTKIVSIEESWLTDQMFKDRKSIIENEYDEKNRLISLSYKGWDNDGNISQLRIEEFEYHTNKYIYRYKESLKKRNGKEKTPLQYELTYMFH